MTKIVELMCYRKFYKVRLSECNVGDRVWYGVSDSNYSVIGPWEVIDPENGILKNRNNIILKNINFNKTVNSFYKPVSKEI